MDRRRGAQRRPLKTMDPLTAALQLQASINNLLTALVSKASTAAIDAMIVAHEARLDRIQKFIDFMADKVFHFDPKA